MCIRDNTRHSDSVCSYTMGFQTSSTFVKVGLSLCVFAFLFSAVSFFSPYWLVSKQLKTDLGVFFKCINGDCSDGSSSDCEYWTSSHDSVLSRQGFDFSARQWVVSDRAIARAMFLSDTRHCPMAPHMGSCGRRNYCPIC